MHRLSDHIVAPSWLIEFHFCVLNFSFTLFVGKHKLVADHVIGGTILHIHGRSEQVSEPSNSQWRGKKKVGKAKSKSDSKGKKIGDAK